MPISALQQCCALCNQRLSLSSDEAEASELRPLDSNDSGSDPTEGHRLKHMVATVLAATQPSQKSSASVEIDGESNNIETFKSTTETQHQAAQQQQCSSKAAATAAIDPGDNQEAATTASRRNIWGTAAFRIRSIGIRAATSAFSAISNIWKPQQQAALVTLSSAERSSSSNSADVTQSSRERLYISVSGAAAMPAAA
jgi:hypothetical protein